MYTYTYMKEPYRIVSVMVYKFLTGFMGSKEASAEGSRKKEREEGDSLRL